MRIKTLILTITLSVCLGIIIFIISNLLIDNKLNHVQQIVTQKSSVLGNQNIVSSPTPYPTLKPLSANANLLEETKKLTPDDFSLDFDKLKEEVEKF